MPARATAVLTAIALVVIAACSSGHSSGSAKTTTSTTLRAATTTTTKASGSTTSTAAPSACTQGDPNGLLPLLPASLVPAGFVQQADTVADTGPSDFKKAVSDDGEKDASVVLTQDGFRRGYQRLWSHPDGRDLIAYVYEFCSDTGATAYAARSARLAKGGGETPFTVTGIPGAIGLAGANSKGDPVALVQAAAGRYLVVTSADGPKAVASAPQLEQMSISTATKMVAEINGPNV